MTHLLSVTFCARPNEGSIHSSHTVCGERTRDLRPIGGVSGPTVGAGMEREERFHL